jgi:hypothetical protein
MRRASPWPDLRVCAKRRLEPGGRLFETRHEANIVGPQPKGLVELHGHVLEREVEEGHETHEGSGHPNWEERDERTVPTRDLKA